MTNADLQQYERDGEYWAKRNAGMIRYAQQLMEKAQ